VIPRVPGRLGFFFCFLSAVDFSIYVNTIGCAGWRLRRHRPAQLGDQPTCLWPCVVNRRSSLGFLLALLNSSQFPARGLQLVVGQQTAELLSKP